MPSFPTLALAKEIVYAYLNDDFNLVIVSGTQRIGKSCYITKAMGQAIEYLFGEDIWNPTIAQAYMGWNPMENVDRWLDIKHRIPCFHWDDAGYWLFSLNWTDPLLIAVQKYMNVVGTDMNTLLLSTPDPTWILSKISGNATMRIKITKKYGTKRKINPPPSIKYSRVAKGYSPYRLPDLKKTGVNKKLEDHFMCLFPDDFYKWYQPTRRAYAQDAKRQIKKAMLDKMRKAERRNEEKRGRPKKG